MLVILKKCTILQKQAKNLPACMIDDIMHFLDEVIRILVSTTTGVMNRERIIIHRHEIQAIPIILQT
jgi:hypothetical protein